MTETMIQQSVIPESMFNDSPRHFSDADWPIGSAAHQGDVILVRIKTLPDSAKPRMNRQVADGNTQGSRHILHGGMIYDVPSADVIAAIKSVCPKSNPAFIGPVYVTDDTTALRHPEHGDHEYDRDMVVAVAFQRNLDAEMQEVRARD